MQEIEKQPYVATLSNRRMVEGLLEGSRQLVLNDEFS